MGRAAGSGRPEERFRGLIGGQCVDGRAVAAQQLAVPVLTADSGVDFIDANLIERGSRRAAERKLASRKRGRDHKAEKQHTSHEMRQPQLHYGSRITIISD
jgi:hypothetical protein